MKFKILHESAGRMRVHIIQRSMTFEEADILLYYLSSQREIVFARVNERIQDAVFNYNCERELIIDMLQHFKYADAKPPVGLIENSGRALSREYEGKLVTKIMLRFIKRTILPMPVRAAINTVMAVKYIKKGVKTLAKGRLEVSVLDATAIGVSLIRRDFKTAGSIMFLLGVGELLEEWTHKKSVDDLARTMSLNINKVWLVNNGQEILVPSSDIQAGDRIIVHMGNVIPFDGEVAEGEAMVEQASLTGESMPVRKSVEDYVYAGTAVEEGELTIIVKEVGGSSRFEKIVTMIEESEKLKSEVESKAERLADILVPFTFAGTALVYLFTRNVTKALSVLMVDFSCALKLAMPVSVLSAIREASVHSITVKGGKFLEAVAEADTVVFDKTGTLTKAAPKVADIISFGDMESDEILRVAACLEEHFPHSMANAVVNAAVERGLLHEEMHSKVEYIVAHGIATTINDKRAIIGSAHFVFEDEKCSVGEGMDKKFEMLPKEHSHLYLAIDGALAGVICIEDPLREEATEVISELKRLGFKKTVMMTGDSERTAAVIAEKVGVDEYYSEVLPEDKAMYVERARQDGHKVIMIGDGINDSPALSAADVGIAISEGAEIAREIADITVGADNLGQLIVLRQISEGLMNRIHWNYRAIVGFNSLLIALGVGSVIQPTTSALLHNTSTLVIGLKNMTNIL